MKKSKLLSLLLAAAVSVSSFAMIAQAAPDDLAEQTEKTVAFAKQSEWAQDDWTIFALGRHQATGCETLYEEYYQGVVEQLNDPAANLIPSDYIRLSLALTAIGVDPRDVEGTDLLQQINEADREEYLQMSPSSLAYGLALMERYPDSFNGTIKEETISQLLAAKQEDGSFSYMAGVAASDPDSTAQAIQGLMLLGDDYAEEVEAAANWLKDQMDENGAIAVDWGSGPSANPSSTAQALIAFSQKGEEPANEQGKTLYDGMMGFALDDGSFKDVNYMTGNLEYSAYTSGQCFQALVAYSRMANGQTAMFDLSDATVTPGFGQEEQPDSSDVSSEEPSSDSSSEPAEEPTSSEESVPAAESAPETGSAGTEEPESPETGDLNVMSIAAVGLIAAAAAVALHKKK